MRVRQILAGLDASGRAAMKKLLPAGMLTIPTLETVGYPTAVLRALPAEQAYSMLGLIAEALLRTRLPTTDDLIHLLEQFLGLPLPPATAKSIRTSVTTPRFLDALQVTRAAIDRLVPVDPPLQFEQVITFDCVEGHPDMRTPTQILEVKLAGQPEKGWCDFVFQLAAYGALAPEATELLLVLPLQKQVFRWKLDGWKERSVLREFLVARAKDAAKHSAMDALVGQMIRNEHRIGCHMPKLKTLRDTVRGLPDYERPYQIFLGGPQNSHVAATDADIAAASEMVAATGAKLYVHSQYIINLCNPGDGAWGTNLLIRNVQVARAAGCRGVVVHVGKSVKIPMATAMETMRGALRAALEHASAECPVLLETPAGQGTETLKGRDEFIGFVESFGDARLRMCLDTCHVFACGHKPMEYLAALDEKRDLVKLIHYNDSAAVCGSCVDRHAFMGTGHIGMEGMRAIADYCGARDWPMLIE